MPGPRRVIRRRGGNKRRTGGLPSKPNVRNLSDKELMQRIGKVKVKPYETYDILGYYPELEPYIMEANRRGLMKGVNLTEKGSKILKKQFSKYTLTKRDITMALKREGLQKSSYHPSRRIRGVGSFSSGFEISRPSPSSDYFLIYPRGNYSVDDIIRCLRAQNIKIDWNHTTKYVVCVPIYQASSPKWKRRK